MVLAATLIGDAKKHIRRSGAKPGDRIYVTGNLGDSACGLEILKRLTPKSIQTVKSEKLKVKNETIKNIFLTLNSQLLTLNWSMAKPLLRRHLMPEARNPKNFTRYATAMIDLSDGLFIDLSRLCDESKTGAKIYMERIPVSGKMRTASSLLGLDAMKLACSVGEDYELLFTTSPTSPIPSLLRRGLGEVKITYIGDIVKSGRKIIDTNGREKKFSPSGYRHFEIQR
ncbi:MAG: hypothetical protein HYR78_07355 [Nitrospirae bacterium]|nr:hypothetical protein [Nitrospirota bacterium]